MLFRSEVNATVGDIGLFASAVAVLAMLPRWVASVGIHQRQAEVSVDRIARLLPDRSPVGLTLPAATTLRHGPGPFPPVPVGSSAARTGDERLERLEVRGLTSAHPAGGGIFDIDLTLERGSLTVITGPVGAGKSTVLPCLLGLAPVDEGATEWNGRVVEDQSQVIVPPQIGRASCRERVWPDESVSVVAVALKKNYNNHT